MLKPTFHKDGRVSVSDVHVGKLVATFDGWIFFPVGGGEPTESQRRGNPAMRIAYDREHTRITEGPPLK